MKRALVSKSCKNCNTVFKQKRHWQDFCSSTCRNDYHADQAREGKKLLGGIKHPEEKEDA